MAGRYDDLAQELVTRTRASGALVLVLEGEKGTGMSLVQRVEWDVAATPEMVEKLPELLREIATRLEKGPIPTPEVKAVRTGGIN